jgi:hypothetical protein
MRVRLAGVPAVLVALATPGAGWAAFRPSIAFSPASRVAGSNPRLDVKITQPAGDEPISDVTFYMSRDFRFPPDAAIADGETLGSGRFTTAIGPVCQQSLQQTFDSTARERDRTQQEIQQGVWTVWVIDLGAVKVDLVITRLPDGSWRSVAQVPTSPAVCPPATLTASLQQTSSVSHVPIWRNPKRPGLYTIRSVLISSVGSTEVIRQRIRFTR